MGLRPIMITRLTLVWPKALVVGSIHGKADRTFSLSICWSAYYHTNHVPFNWWNMSSSMSYHLSYVSCIIAYQDLAWPISLQGGGILEICTPSMMWWIAMLEFNTPMPANYWLVAGMGSHVPITGDRPLAHNDCPKYCCWPKALVIGVDGMRGGLILQFLCPSVHPSIHPSVHPSITT